MKRYEIKHRMKGAITVFMVIVYIWVFILMGVLVDGARIRLAQAQAEQTQQIANETMLTYYNRALYEYYDLFGETYLPAESMESLIRDIMEQSMSLELNGDLQEAMESRWLFTLDGGNYFDPYDLTVDSIEAGSSINLLDKEVFVSQVGDAMKYSAPLILVNNLANLVDSFGAASDGVKAVNECNNTISNISDEIQEYMKELEQLRYQLNNFCEEPWESLSTEEKLSAQADDPLEYAQEFDEEAKRAVSGVINQILETADKQEDSSRMDRRLNEAYDDYKDKMDRVHSNGQALHRRTQELIQRGERIKSDIAAARSQLASKGTAQSNEQIGEIYNSYGDVLEESEKAVEKYGQTLDGLLVYLHVVQSGSLISWTSYQAACETVRNHLKQTHDADAYKMAEDPTVKQFSETLTTQFNNILEESGGLAQIEVDESKLEEVEKQLKEKNTEETADAEDSVEDTDRLGWVTTIRETSQSAGDTSYGGSYDRGNAQETADKLGDTATDLVDMMANAGNALMDNLYEDAYVLTNFRDYVHTYKMLNPDGTNNSGKDGYDTVANIKFLEGEKGLLTREQFQQIENTCAEIEYVIYGIQETKSSVAAAYASIYGYRLALDYASVFLTEPYRGTVMTAAAEAGPLAPVVIALYPLIYAVPRAAMDMTMIMRGQCTPLLYKKSEDWWKMDFANSKEYLAGYSDYLLIQLLTMNKDKKIERMQDIVQMNMRTIDRNFTLERALVNAYAQSSCSIRYLFITQAFMPTAARKDGRYSFKISTNVSY